MFYLTTHSTHFIYGYMEGRKEMFYLTMHSIHFIYGYMEGMNEMKFNDVHNTFYLRLYGGSRGLCIISKPISRFSQCSTTGVTKAVVCVILSVRWCI